MLSFPGADPGFWNGGWIFSTSIREIREIKYYFNIWGIRKKKRKKGAQKKGGENSPISPPLDPCLLSWWVFIEKKMKRERAMAGWTMPWIRASQGWEKKGHEWCHEVEQTGAIERRWSTRKIDFQVNSHVDWPRLCAALQEKSRYSSDDQQEKPNIFTLLIIKITISSIVIGLKKSYFPLIQLLSCYRTVQ